jgi:uncharacterized protein
MQKIALITGAHGCLGSALSLALTQAGWHVRHVVRHANSQAPDIFWDPYRQQTDSAQWEKVDAVFHLAGRSLDARWTDNFMNVFYSERKTAAAYLHRVLGELKTQPQVVIVASASGIYGPNLNQSMVFTEADTPATDWLARTCQAIETTPVTPIYRTILARFGVILNQRHGALAKMLPALYMGLGGAIGSGNQRISWISTSDAVQALIFLADTPTASGAYNVCAPQAIPQTNFAQTLAAQLRRPCFMPLPAFMVRLMFGRMGQALLLDDRAMAPARLTKLGFNWQHPTLKAALEHILK